MINCLYFSSIIRLHPFPGKKRKPDERLKWCRLINRKKMNGSLWSPSSKSRVCSEHFNDGCEYPTKNLGYNSEEKVMKIFPQTKRRKLEYKTSMPDEEVDSVITTPLAEKDDQEIMFETVIEEPSSSMKDNVAAVKKLKAEKDALIFALADCQTVLVARKRRISRLRKTIQVLNECPCKNLEKSLLKSQSDVQFYTGLPNINIFDDILKLSSPFMEKKWQGKKKTNPLKKRNTKMGRKTILSSRAELLLTLMKLCLNLPEKDLSHRFNISISTVSSTFKTWIRLLSRLLKCLIFVPDQGSLNFTRPERFNLVKDVSQIIDCFEVFIETPKSLELQKATWSEYKHHNTIKFLIACLPNSTVSFLSLSYPGSISDQKIVRHSNFLDTVPLYSYVMADKGFDIAKDCEARRIGFYVPPGKQGTYQMLSSEVRKTKRVANLRILIEQVIRQVRSFRILSQEVPISLLPCIDDIASVCASLVNFKTPIFKD